MYEVDLMVFDLDGTLVNSAPDIISSVNFTRNFLGMPALEDGEIIRCVGDGTDKLIERVVDHEHRHRAAEALEVFLAYYDDHLLDETRLYEGMRETLDHFSAKRKIIITNKQIRFTAKITRGIDIADYFEDIIGVGSTPYRKPDPRVLLPLLEKYEVHRDRALILGDGVNDVTLAKNAGVKSCAMLNGFTSREVLFSLKPDFVSENPLDLKEMFC